MQILPVALAGGGCPRAASAAPATLSPSALAPATRGRSSGFAFNALPASPPGGHLPPPQSPEGPLKNVYLMASNPFPGKTPLGKFLCLCEGHLDAQVPDPRSELRLAAGVTALLPLSLFARRRASLLPPRPRNPSADTQGWGLASRCRGSARPGRSAGSPGK